MNEDDTIYSLPGRHNTYLLKDSEISAIKRKLIVGESRTKLWELGQHEGERVGAEGKSTRSAGRTTRFVMNDQEVVSILYDTNLKMERVLVHTVHDVFPNIISKILHMCSGTPADPPWRPEDPHDLFSLPPKICIFKAYISVFIQFSPFFFQPFHFFP